MPPPISDGSRGKPVTRRTVLSRRDAMTGELRAAASEWIAIATEPLLIDRGVIALYASKGSEVDTLRIDAIARERGLRIVYPRVIDRDRKLVFHEVTSEQLAIAQFGLREPQVDHARVELAEIGAFVIPGLAFDREGGRVGWGRGHYDATLAAAPGALRIGLAFDCQIIDHVPRDPHDAVLDYVVTEVAIYRTPR